MTWKIFQKLKSPSARKEADISSTKKRSLLNVSDIDFFLSIVFVCKTSHQTFFGGTSNKFIFSKFNKHIKLIRKIKNEDVK